MGDLEPVDKYPQLKTRFLRLLDLKQKHLDVCGEMLAAAGGNLYPTDLVILAILKRSLDLVDAFQVLIRRWNFNAAAPLLRIQLDSVLKLSYLSQTEGADNVGRVMLSGKSLRHLKDREGKPLTDARLRDYARPSCPWLDKVYKETSRMVHLSEKHFSITVQSLSEEDRGVSLAVGTGTHNWPLPEIESFVDATIVATATILSLADSWVAAKTQFYAASQLQSQAPRA